MVTCCLLIGEKMIRKKYMQRFVVYTLMLMTLSIQMAIADDLGRLGTLDKPIDVHVRMYIIDIDKVDTPEQRFSANVYYTARWHDSRLAHNNKKSISLPLSKVWNPRLQFVNQQQINQTFPEIVEVSSKGDVVYRQRVWGNFSQPLQLKHFPFDSQQLHILMVAAGYTPQEVEIVVDKDNFSGIGETSQPDWNIVSWQFKNTPYQVKKATPIVPGFTFTVNVQRKENYYVFNFIIPLLLIVCMSLIVFWLDPRDSATRIRLASTVILTLIAYRFVIATILPKVSYLTRLDWFILSATAIVFSTLIVAAISSVSVKRDNLALALSIDKACRWLYPAFLIVLIILPFLLYR
jgi:Neurotransmitter-gated ion-channel ligand binding domain/Neurotransmitter-gated ion-channel transmembrane region